VCSLSILRKHLAKLLGEREHLERLSQETQQKLSCAKHRESTALEAQKHVQELAETVQSTAHSQIAAVITRCLQAVSDDPYEFCIKFEQKRGKTEADATFIKEGHELDPMCEAGGGVADTAAFAAQITNLLLAKPQRRKFLIFDEPFRNLHGAHFRAKVGQMIEELSHELGIQFLLFTSDDTDLPIGKVVSL